MLCKHCGSPLTLDVDVLVDETGGDVCPIASLDPNENRPHELEDGSHRRNEPFCAKCGGACQYDADGNSLE